MCVNSTSNYRTRWQYCMSATGKRLASRQLAHYANTDGDQRSVQLSVCVLRLLQLAVDLCRTAVSAGWLWRCRTNQYTPRLLRLTAWVTDSTDAQCIVSGKKNKKAQLTQRERATAVHVWRPTANKCKIRKNLYFSAQGHSRSLLSVSIETRVWLPISD